MRISRVGRLLASGAAAGCTATLPMTLVMLALHRRLPRDERWALPPRQIALRIAGRFGLRHRMAEPARSVTTLVSHFAFGAAMGAAYAPLGSVLPRSQGAQLTGGVLFGLLVWSGPRATSAYCRRPGCSLPRRNSPRAATSAGCPARG
ncbi:MAG: hypothetical protein AVDCRST_MAG77-3456 [uncultured Chloroflexi bacterium]|uniref:Uncharacterized protein n=1 Tax=uncultured Chloroflexota bacterium TaxID=166587 RepID=A0A6J4JDK1_9CHLR|nr:MAG: hypothetical protein AVDCRST_MAG77-3456 [uncultured Chloroflexota bacterium]